MELLEKYMGAYLRVTGGSVGSMRASVQFISAMTSRLIQEEGLPDLATASAVVSGWSFVLRIQNYTAWFDPETGELDRCVTLTDQDVSFFVKEQPIPFERVDTIHAPMPMGDLRIQYTLGGGKFFHGAPYRRSLNSSGLKFCPATIILMFVKLRLKRGVNVKAEKLFHRFADDGSGFVQYSIVYNELKKENKLQDVKGKGVTPNRLRSPIDCARGASTPTPRHTDTQPPKDSIIGYPSPIGSTSTHPMFHPHVFEI